MPVYIYKHPEEEIYKEIVQTMSESHVYSEDGIEWKRVFTVPQTSIDTNIDPFSQNQFRERTGSKKGTVGDLLDYSAEQSRKRSEVIGSEDPVKRKYFDDYAKKRKGQKHIADKKVYESKNVKVEYD